RFEAVHVNGQLGGALDVRRIKKFPAVKLGAIREIGIFGERVVLPASGVCNGFAAPHARGAVEIKEGAAARTRAMFDDEMAVEKNRFHLSEQRIIAIEIGPARLNHTDFGILEIGNAAAEKVRRGNEVGVEDDDELAQGSFEAVL